jgi:hypothetical protein
MILTYLMLFVALCLSAVAAFYSIIGLTAIFAAAVIPIVIMGTILEAAKLVVTVWLHEYWGQVKRSMKCYLVPAVATLMVITSMGIFGFLSKAHLDQAVPAGDISAQVAIFDEKIKTQRDNIDAARNALKQMDAAVDQTMSRSTDEKGAERAVQIRRSQQAERNRLQQEITRAQAEIVKLNEQRAPVAAEARKVEAEVGPIKYIAALIYGDNPDANLLEKAVRWVIIILVAVFDPLAVMMLLASTESYRWERQARAVRKEEKQDASELDDTVEPSAKDMDRLDAGDPDDVQPLATDIPSEQWGGQDLTHHIDKKSQSKFDYTPPAGLWPRPDPEQLVPVTEDDEDDKDDAQTKKAKRIWKEFNPGQTLKEQRKLLSSGMIDHLPWEDYLDTNLEDIVQFGTAWPEEPVRGQMFLRTDILPTVLYKFNGTKWIEVDKNMHDLYVYNEAYIDYLIEKIKSGEYDPELLNDSERNQLEQRLRREIE